MMSLESLSFTDLIALRNELSEEVKKRLAYIVLWRGVYTEVQLDQLIIQANQEITKRITGLIKEQDNVQAGDIDKSH